MYGQNQENTDIARLLDVLPPHVQAHLDPAMAQESLIEIVLDLGRLPTARLAGEERHLGAAEVSAADLAYVTARLCAFGEDNRAGIPRTLHRISAIRNRRGEIIGLTCRVGRAVFGTLDIIRDLVCAGKSVLLLGRPGVGKTTLL